ncbi:MAG: pentapeptide repeat-containing protein [Ilumatobacteraceae bacterium]
MSTTVVTTTAPPSCSMFIDDVCPPGGLDPRLACIPECAGLDLSGVVAPGLNEWVSFEDANLTGADFSGAFVDGWSMSGANLTDSRFVDANLLNVRFDHQDMRRANFGSATMYQTTFCDVDLTDAFFDDALLESASFAKAILSGVSFEGARTLSEQEWIANGASGTFGVVFSETSIDGVVPSINFGPTPEAASSAGLVEDC